MKPKIPAMNFTFLLSLIFATALTSLAQDSASKISEKEIVIEHGTQKKPIKIKIDDWVEIQLKNPVKRIGATVSSFADASITIRFNEAPYTLVILIENIASIRVINQTRVYQAKIVLLDKTVVRGVLNKLYESEIEIAISNSSKSDESLIKISVDRINKIYLKRKSLAGKGFKIGFLIGASMGAILGAADPFTEGDAGGKVAAVAGGAIVLGLSGGLVGALVGAGAGGIPKELRIPKEFSINGDLENYKKMRARVAGNVKQAE